MRRLAVAVGLVVFAAGCGADPPSGGGDDVGFPDADGALGLAIVSVSAPESLRAGSPIHIQARGLSTDEPPTLSIRIGGAAFSADARSADPLSFGLPVDAAALLGEEPTDVELVLVAGASESEVWQARWRAAGPLVVSLERIDEPRATWNARLALQSRGVLLDGEGQTLATLSGELSTAGGGTRLVEATLPVTPVDPLSRARAFVTLSPSLGGVSRGRFVGTMQIESTPVVGGSVRSDAVPMSIVLDPPEVFDVSPLSAPIGALLNVRGAGFVGTEADAALGAATVLRLAGRFSGPDGSVEGSLELVPEVVDGALATVVIPGEVSDGRLVASWVGAARGSFDGTIAPEVLGPNDSDSGEAAPLRFDIAPVVQVVELRYLRGFDASLVEFGLGSAVAEVRSQVLARLRALFTGLRVDFRTTPPTDFAPGYFAIVELGGPDPNGLGLLGYDNTPGKDVGNLRLGDRIGGANARTQEDGYPGFGGVFVENFLYWSETPGLPGPTPPGAPTPDPLFDEVFGPVRARPATLDEVRGVGDAARVAAVSAAVRSLAWMIAETTAHELGHSLGLARPDQPSGAYHNLDDGPGCLMDAGPDRPFGERAGLPGFAESHFCEQSAEYLQSILGTPPE